MKVVLHLRTLCVLAGAAWLGSAAHATEPVAQAIPYLWDFSTWEASSTNYPPGLTGWKIGVDASTQYIFTPAVSDALLIAPSSASATSGGVHNYAGKLGILDTGSGAYALACAFSTYGKKNIVITYDIMTIRNPFDGLSNTRTNACGLQYRIGTSGNFLLAGVSYTNDATQQKTGTAPLNPCTQTFVLPASCDNQQSVQLRWAVRDLSGKGLRPSFAMGRIHITAEEGPISLLPPQNIRVTSITATSFCLTWDAASPATEYAIDVYASLDTRGDAFFSESFSGFAGSSNISRENTLDSYTQTNGWSGAAVYEALGSIRLGNSSTRGWIQTPLLSPPETCSIRFDARAWPGTSEATTIDVYAIQGGATNILDTINLSTNAMQSYVIPTESAQEAIFGFTAKRSTNNRFYLDNLSLTAVNSSVTNSMRVPCNSAIIQGLTPGVRYQGVIRSMHGADQSANSSAFTAKTFNATLLMFN
jgi:hypothetical protein